MMKTLKKILYILQVAADRVLNFMTWMLSERVLDAVNDTSLSGDEVDAVAAAEQVRLFGWSVRERDAQL